MCRVSAGVPGTRECVLFLHIIFFHRIFVHAVLRHAVLVHFVFVHFVLRHAVLGHRVLFHVIGGEGGGGERYGQTERSGSKSLDRGGTGHFLILLRMSMVLIAPPPSNSIRYRSRLHERRRGPPLTFDKAKRSNGEFRPCSRSEHGNDRSRFPPPWDIEEYNRGCFI